MNCNDCDHSWYCAGSDSYEWQERVAICVEAGVGEDEAMEIACRQARGEYEPRS